MCPIHYIILQDLEKQLMSRESVVKVQVPQYYHEIIE